MANQIDIGDLSRLALLMDIGSGRVITWTSDDLGEILQHQLQALLLSELEFNPTQIRMLELLACDPTQLPLRTFGDLLFHPNPPQWLVQKVKDFAKGADQKVEHPIPPEVAIVIYYCLIAAALARQESQITGLTLLDLRMGFDWVERQTWVDMELKKLVQVAAGELDKNQ